jgi:hypothetical protein
MTVAGYRLTGGQRRSELGVWQTAVAPDGRPAGVLRFDMSRLPDAGAVERLAALAGALRGCPWPTSSACAARCGC